MVLGFCVVWHGFGCLSAGDSTIHRHASTRCPAEEAGTIVCPETPALRAERGDSPMLCEALPALIVIFKKS